MAKSIWNAEPSRRDLIAGGAVGALIAHAAIAPAMRPSRQQLLPLLQDRSPSAIPHRRSMTGSCHRRSMPRRSASTGSSCPVARTLRPGPGRRGEEALDRAALWPTELVEAGTPGMEMMPMPPKSAVGSSRSTALTARPSGF